MNTLEKDAAYIAATYHRRPAVFTAGHGARVTDENGNSYIDFGAGIAVTSLGFADEGYNKAVTEQLSAFQHSSNYYATKPGADLAEQLCLRSGMKKVFFSNSGAEANECAIKTARKYSSDKYGDGRSTVVTMCGSFHGRTLATLAATGQDAFHTHFGPFPGGFEYAAFNDIESVKSLTQRGDVCAVMTEVIQGEGGVNTADFGFLRALSQLCRGNDILLIVDEVQTGNGRCGALYSYMLAGIEPDIVTTAKGLAGGLPIGATLFGSKACDVLGAGDHGSTFGGNPVCAAATLYVLSRIDDALLASVREKGEIIRRSLADTDGVTGISGLGLMLGISVKGNAAKIADRALEKGLLVLTAKDKIRLLPPLTISYDEIKEGTEILKGAINDETPA